MWPPEGSNKTHKTMLVIAIIALVLSLVAIAVGTILIFRISALFGEFGEFEKDIRNDIAGLKQAVKDLEKEDCTQEYDGLPGVSYDVDKKTLLVSGNIDAKGWISAGKIGKEE